MVILLFERRSFGVIRYLEKLTSIIAHQYGTSGGKHVINYVLEIIDFVNAKYVFFLNPFIVKS